VIARARSAVLAYLAAAIVCSPLALLVWLASDPDQTSPPSAEIPVLSGGCGLSAESCELP
jgi:hypothetical protein